MVGGWHMGLPRSSFTEHPELEVVEVFITLLIRWSQVSSLLLARGEGAAAALLFLLFCVLVYAG